MFPFLWFCLHVHILDTVVTEVNFLQSKRIFSFEAYTLIPTFVEFLNSRVPIIVFSKRSHLSSAELRSE